MGLILDTGVLIASERRGESIEDILRQARALHGEVDIAMSTVSVVELTHGIYRARSAAQQERRRLFAESAFQDLIVHPVSLEIAQLAGKIEGEQATQGITIAFEDLVIGATALHFCFDVATLNVKHFKLIPGLKIVAVGFAISSITAPAPTHCRYSSHTSSPGPPLSYPGSPKSPR